ncbi:hypothetical protein RvY_06901, partial [Ramazzottius varieornatus]
LFQIRQTPVYSIFHMGVIWSVQDSFRSPDMISAESTKYGSVMYFNLCRNFHTAQLVIGSEEAQDILVLLWRCNPRTSSRFLHLPLVDFRIVVAQHITPPRVTLF